MKDLIKVDLKNYRYKTVQFDIDNTGNSCDNQIVRIGSKTSAPGIYESLVLTPGASDNDVISDQGGNGCLSIQEFSRDTCNQKINVAKIYIFSDCMTQVNASFLHRTINSELVIINRSNNIIFFRKCDDHGPELDTPYEYRNVASGSWHLSENEWLEFTSYAGQKFTIVLIYSKA